MPNKLEKDENATRDLARSLLYEALGLGYIPYDTRPLSRPPRRWDRKAILAAVREYIQRTGQVPRDIEFRSAMKHGLPSRQAVQRYWVRVPFAVQDALRTMRKEDYDAEETGERETTGNMARMATDTMGPAARAVEFD